MYLFDHYQREEWQIYLNEMPFTSELEDLGFSPTAINEAAEWVKGLYQAIDQLRYLGSQPTSSRLFDPNEQAILDTSCRNFLYYLESLRILNSYTREIVIDRLLALEIGQVELTEVKWVTLMVLYHLPDEKASLACMERLVLAEQVGNIH